jgi:hypothetical protein
MIEMFRSKSIDPEVEQNQITQHPVEEFGGKRAVWCNQIARSQKPR